MILETFVSFLFCSEPARPVHGQEFEIKVASGKRSKKALKFFDADQ